ncbi:nucleotidyltransferase family protein [Bacteroides sp. 519]|uniref:nucleotidyltransferase domain-containing protein n=1 Tax=Bacteroides sp. 519 TaxID=2302937 RepID=UPI0013D7C285|nr:nucleotidyltransferase family protein [Bacteroides sp. 519]NDV60223.1 hypothetical protein [Bacteroides sp. 519]
MIKPVDLLFTLLRFSLNVEENNINTSTSAFAEATNDDWQRVFKLSVEQGVLLLCYGGWQCLPANLQPFCKLKLRWCANVVKANERYERYKTVIDKLSVLFLENNIKLLIIKGITLSELYPTPYYREVGDIDVFVAGNTTKANKLLSRVGMRHEEEIPKHTTFNLGGIAVENHYTLFDTTLPFGKERQLYVQMEKLLRNMLADCTCLTVYSNSVFQLPPQVAALHFIGHTFRHFCCMDMNIRQLCDWTIFFTTYRKEIDSNLLSMQINELGLAKFVCHINAVCSGYLGFEPYFMLPAKTDKQAEHFILKTIMRYKVNPSIPVWSVLCNLFYRNRIYKKYLGKVTFPEFLYPEIKSYLVSKLKPQ